ncbi:MAG: lysozyme inhibitor LprI family protein [Pseudomonadota bacterium]
MRTVFLVSAVVAYAIACSPEPTEQPPAPSEPTTTETPTPGRMTLPSDRCSSLAGFERMRCADPDLKRMDDELASLVARQIAHADHDGKADVRAAQATWQREVRNPCMELGQPKRTQCFSAAYTARMNAVRDAL